jgi:hypothetical protein
MAILNRRSRGATRECRRAEVELGVAGRSVGFVVGRFLVGRQRPDPLRGGGVRSGRHWPQVRQQEPSSHCRQVSLPATLVIKARGQATQGSTQTASATARQGEFARRLGIQRELETPPGEPTVALSLPTTLKSRIRVARSAPAVSPCLPAALASAQIHLPAKQHFGWSGTKCILWLWKQVSNPV